jgi:hypothetical protein
MLGYAVIAIIILALVAPAGRRALRRRWSTKSPAVQAAVDFWTSKLRPCEVLSPERNQEVRQIFASTLHDALVDAYVSNGVFPAIGVFYYAPYHYGIDNLMYAALYSTGTVSPINRDIAHHHFDAWGKMEISLKRVRISNGSGEQLVWDSGATGAGLAAGPGNDTVCGSVTTTMT